MKTQFDINEFIGLPGGNYEKTFWGDESVILYGTGAVAQVLLEYGKPIPNLVGVCDKHVTTNSFYEYPLYSIPEIMKKNQDFKVAISSFKYYEEIKEELLEWLPEDRILPYTNWETRVHYNMVSGDYEKWLLENEQILCWIYENLTDEKSRNSFRYALKGLEHVRVDEWLGTAPISYDGLANYFTSGILPIGDEEVYLDVGAFDGDSIEAFLNATNGRYKKIIGYEPDETVFQQLKSKIEILDPYNISVFPHVLGAKEGQIGFEVSANRLLNKIAEDALSYVNVDTIDGLGEDITWIKIAVKGTKNVLSILDGGKQLLKSRPPRMAIVASPTENDILEIPKKVLELNDSYQVYFRMVSYPQSGGQRTSMCYFFKV